MKKKIFALIALLGFLNVALAQTNTYHSVLSQHTWHRLSVAQEGVYKLDYATLQAMGVDVSALNPNQIRIFGNPSGALPEKNSDARPDDLSELAIYVSGADDGSFDAADYVLFYGQEPTRWTLTGNVDLKYVRERNYYSDSTYYFLCVDSGEAGLRVATKASLPVEGVTTVIADFPDCQWHEEELFSPYSIGQNWYGEYATLQAPDLQLDFVFPNLVASKPTRLKAEVLGRSTGVAMHYNMNVNNNVLVNNGSISQVQENYYGYPASVDRQIVLEGDTAHFGLSLVNGSQSARLFLDYVEIHAWRQLKRVGDFFPFRLMPSQFGAEESAIWIQNVGNAHWLWDVTNPLAPVLQEGRLSAGNLVFAIDENIERRYALFDPAKARPVDGWTAIENQDIHAIADADMLIITAPHFLSQAQELADFHAEKDGLLSVVVNVDHIFNEFGTGTPDPTGIRDFIRMVYRRSAGHLKYVTLFGRASFDFRDLLGYDLNRVPCYETMIQPYHETSFCTDDYFGLMDDGEGVNSGGRVDLGVGRLPVSTPEEADDILLKIKHYADRRATHGEWMTNHLFVSDDETKSYLTNNEDYNAAMDTLAPAININKVYCGVYQRVSTTSGSRFPQVNADIVDNIENGLLSLTYTGHGGVVALADERIFGTTEIATLNNFDRLPFVFTATCEFSKYDNPLLLSAGEQMFLQPNGGAIAMLTTVRLTYGVNNVKIGRAMTTVLYNRDSNGRALRIGDISRMAKANPANFTNSSASTVSSNISHVLFGDPALRLAMPEEEVKTLRVNGMAAGADEVQLHAMSMVTVEGEIHTALGQFDSQFNGELWVRFFDQKLRMTVPYDGGSLPVSYHKDVLYRGKATVRNGRFTLAFQVPKDISPDFGEPRFSYYAYDSIRDIDAMGYFDGLTIGGTDPAMVPDDEGPKITFYWNSPDFENGDVVEASGVLYADLYDAQGIYHYDFSLGRNILLNSDLNACNNLVLNDHFEPAIDDFRRGRVVLPVNDMPAGTYKFTLKVWDMQDNPAEASLWLTVGRSPDAFLAQVSSLPNPFADETWFSFAHYGDDGQFDVNIELFDMLGRQVASLRKNVATENNISEPIRWDGRNSQGAPLPTGLYFYRLTITDETGFSRTVSQKVMINR